MALWDRNYPPPPSLSRNLPARDASRHDCTLPGTPTLLFQTPTACPLSERIHPMLLGHQGPNGV